MSRIEEYRKFIDEYVEKAYEISNKARAQGFDPKDKVEMPIAKEISQRVEGLISIEVPSILNSGVAKRILELEKKYGKLDWRVSLEIALETAQNKFIKFENEKLSIETGIRVGFAYATLGVISAPLEGFIGIDIKKTFDDEDYICMNFAGPIRAAGGTAGAVCILIGDYVRKKLNYVNYDPNKIEIKRTYIELMDYNDRAVRLQYLPSEEEVEFLVKNLGVEISGDPTELIEVSNYKDLPRIKTNRIRGGMCLVLGECLIQKAPKLYKKISIWGSKFELESWLFLKDFLNLQKKIKSHTKEKIDNVGKEKKVLPNYKFIEDMVAGRPVLTFPMRKGGLRLRYGRCRTSGFASTSISRETLQILDNFIAVGTQLKTERPGKATVISAVDNLETPIVRLKNGDVVNLKNDDLINEYRNEIEEILHLGDILISFGEFSENNQNLVPNGYCEEEWALELIEKINNEK
jgi:DNA polymerase II large subunit